MTNWLPIWLIWGLIAAFCYASNAITNKVVTSEKYLGIGVLAASLLMLIGICLTFLAYFLGTQANLTPSIKIGGIILAILFTAYLLYAVIIGLNVNPLPLTIGLGLLQGIFWGVGMIATFLAWQTGVDAARLVPIYNTNTLIAVAIGLILLHEVPVATERIKVIAGAILVVIGGILVAG